VALILDAGALVAVERRDGRVRSLIARNELRGAAMITSAGVVAQVWRGGARQANVARVLGGTEVRAMDHATARRIGELLGVTRTRDVVDAHVALLAHSDDTLLTSDPGDLKPLLEALAVAPLLVRL
jgi:hypothetical protein